MKQQSLPLLMTHVVLGYPSLNESIDLVQTMADSGASLIELQIPFSDPIADGPTIMEANQQALATGITPRDCMKAMKTLRKKVSVPLLFMSYFNVVLNYRGSVKGFVSEARLAGADGIIVPDIPPEEKVEHFWPLASSGGLIPIPLVSPVTSDKRLKQIYNHADKRGFVYCVSTTGTTGARKTLPSDLKSYLARVRKIFDMPIAVGFGISKRDHIQALKGQADIAIVGSAVIEIIRKANSRKERLRKVRAFVESLCH